MNTNQTEADQRVQSNRQLKEWSDQIATDIKARYVLSGKHKQERSYLLLEEPSALEQSRLATQQMEELNRLKQQHSETRVAIQQRHSQENTEWVSSPNRTGRNAATPPVRAAADQRPVVRMIPERESR